MFTASGGLAEVVAFMSGCEVVARRDVASTVDQSPQDFLNWLASEAGVENRDCTSPSTLVEEASQRFGSEAAVLEAALQYFHVDRP